MISSPRGDADVGNVVPRGNRRHESLGAVASGHPDHLRAARDRALSQLEQVIAGPQNDGFDTPSPSFSSEVEALGLSATRLQVDYQHGRTGGPHRRDRREHAAHRGRSGPPQCVARGESENSQQQQQCNQHHHPLPVGHHHHDQPDRTERGERGAGRPPQTATGQCEPDGGAADQHERDRQQRDGHIARQRDGGHYSHRNRREKRDDSGDARQQ